MSLNEVSSSSGSEIWHDPENGTFAVNSSGYSTDIVMSQLTEQHPEIAQLVRWGNQTRRGGLFERDRYVTPSRIYDQMRVAQDAAESDDIVAGVLESTEALAFNRMSIECDDEDEQNVWNQIIADIDLDARIREMWRELFVVSQFYVAQWWGQKDYKVQGRSKETGVARKKQFPGLQVPTSLSILDPLKVAPVGNFMFNQEQLAWIADDIEGYEIAQVLQNTDDGDETVRRLLTSRYEPDFLESRRLGALGVNMRNLFTLNPEMVWRYTATRSQYRVFADIRMRSIFELLDLKHILREMDRAHLLGATNFILLVKKGSPDRPPKPEELANLQASMRTLSQVPVIVGDHRIDIEIITPTVDYTLNAEKHNMIDTRITARLYGMFMTGGFAGTRADDSIKLARIVARGLESRRQMLKQAIERNVLMPIYERNPQLTTIPSLEFHPTHIALDFDAGLAAFFMDLRDRREISRSTLLEQVDLDEDKEARTRQRESKDYDDIFHSISALNDPETQAKQALDLQKQGHEQELESMDKQNELDIKKIKATPKPVVQPGGVAADPKSAGRAGGGNKNGGGAAPGSGQGQPKDPRRKAGG